MSGEVTRVGAIDVGSNSVKLLVADVSGGSVVEIERYGRVTRLARDVARTGMLRPDAIAETRDALSGCHARARELGATAIAAVATGVLRQARDGARVAAVLGRPIGGLTVLSETVESTLSFLGVRAGAGWPATLQSVDIGGASTEFARLSGDRFHAISLGLGAVYAAETFLGDLPTEADWARLDHAIDSALEVGLVRARDEHIPLHAVGGAASGLGMIRFGLDRASEVQGRCIGVEHVRSILERLASVPADERARVFGISRRRADILLSGARILLRIMAFLDQAEIVLSARGLRHGVALVAHVAPEALVDGAAATRLAANERISEGKPNGADVSTFNEGGGRVSS